MKHITFPPFPKCKLAFCTITLICIFPISMICAEEAEDRLSKEIAKIAKTIESLQTKDPYAPQALKFANELKAAARGNRPDLIESLKSNSNHQKYLGVYYDALNALFHEVSERTAKISEQLRKEWAAQVDKFVQKTENACVNDLPSAELEKLLVEVAGIRLNQPKINKATTTWLKMTLAKLDAASKLLVSWIDYKRLKEKKFDQQAAAKLTSIVNSNTSFPILSRDFLVAKIPKVKAPYIPTKRDLNPFGSPREDLGKHKPDISQVQQKILKSLESKNLDAKTLETASVQLDRLPVKKEDRIADSIRVLAECLAHLESKNFPAARDRLSLFCRFSDAIPEMRTYRSKVAADLVPILFSEIKAKPRDPDQHIRLYLFDLISEPTSMEEVAIRKEFIRFYGDFDGYRRRIFWGSQWVASSTKQYLYLLRAKSAIDIQDYARALENFRTALDYSADAAPAGAGNFIAIQIEKLKLLAPALFDIETSPYFKEINILKKRVSDLELELHNKSKK